MSKTIAFTSRFQKWLFILMGAIFLFRSIRSIYHGDHQLTGLLYVDIAFLIAGLIGIVYSILLFWSSPKIRLDDNGIFYKEGIFKEPQIIDWSNVKKIGYNPYLIDFYLSDRSLKTMKIRSTAETALIIKRAIKEFAEINQIEIKGR